MQVKCSHVQVQPSASHVWVQSSASEVKCNCKCRTVRYKSLQMQVQVQCSQIRVPSNASAVKCKLSAVKCKWLIDWVGVYCPVSMLVAIWDPHVKDMRWAVCDSSSWSPKQEVTSDMKFADREGHFKLSASESPVWVSQKQLKCHQMQEHSSTIAVKCLQMQVQSSASHKQVQPSTT